MILLKQARNTAKERGYSLNAFQESFFGQLDALRQNRNLMLADGRIKSGDAHFFRDYSTLLSRFPMCTGQHMVQFLLEASHAALFSADCIDTELDEFREDEQLSVWQGQAVSVVLLPLDTVERRTSKQVDLPSVWKAMHDTLVRSALKREQVPLLVVYGTQSMY